MENEQKIIAISRMGHPVLFHQALSVKNVHDPDVQQIIDDMILAHQQQGGVGLAAPQIYIPLRIILYQVTPKAAASRNVPETAVHVLVNPVMEILDETLVRDWEGCLSVPGMYGEVARHKKVRYTALDRFGNTVTEELEGYPARIIQHEIDHINGTLYLMRLDNMKRFGFLDEIRANFFG